MFSAAFGLGFRPLISDFLTGIVFIFEDTLDVGEKVSIVGPWCNFEGVVEKVSLRAVHLRGTSGEMMAVPNGEIRIIRWVELDHLNQASSKVTPEPAKSLRRIVMPSSRRPTRSGIGSRCSSSSS